MTQTIRIALWPKDGAWHITEIYEPTVLDHQRFPVSYPPRSTGPFYKWRPESYATEEEARLALAALDA